MGALFFLYKPRIMRIVMLFSLIVAALFVQSATVSPWKDSSVIKIIEERCHHCPDWTYYSFKLDDGTVYVGQSHKKLEVTLNGHTMFRFEKDAYVGDYIHILDDFGKDRRLRITEKIAPAKQAESFRSDDGHSSSGFRKEVGGEVDSTMDVRKADKL